MMRVTGLILLAFLLLSCGSQSGIEYHIQNADAQTQLAANIGKWDNAGYKAFLIFGKEDGYNRVDIIPYRQKNQKVNGLKLSRTNRKLILGGKSYYIFFDFDNELAATRREEISKGEKVSVIIKYHTIYDLATTLYFDKDWNFVK